MFVITGLIGLGSAYFVAQPVITAIDKAASQVAKSVFDTYSEIREWSDNRKHEQEKLLREEKKAEWKQRATFIREKYQLKKE